MAKTHHREIDVTDHDGSAKGLSLGGTLVTASGAEVNALDGLTADVNELNTLENGTGVQKFSETMAFGDFTDGGGAVGTYDITAGTLPIGAFFLGASLIALTGFAGDVSAALTVGDGSDVDRYNTGTPDVFTTAANGVSLGAPSGDPYHDAAATIKLTITVNADWGNVTAGALTIEFYYLT